MDLDRHRRLEDVFQEAVDKPPHARARFVADACHGDSAMASDVMALIAADDTRASVLDTPACDVLLGSASIPVLSGGQLVGGYEVVRLLGKGGMGQVYEAIQDKPRRSVALKVLRRALPSDAERHRFSSEAEFLGRLRHPNIAAIYDAGLHQEGHSCVPYFVMEYVPDSKNPIDYARSRQLTTDARLELFLQVCKAVQYGHLKGIVHRDLKPGNILVDPAGHPKIIDYGVACALGDDGQGDFTSSSIDNAVGTPHYMSPEQLANDQDNIDTRSDVYSLGVLLLEMLAGPQPPRPSLSAVGKPLEHEQRARITNNKSLDGDLSLIVAKAMEPAREQRYQSAGELASDIERYLRKEPIQARTATIFYRLSRFAIRNKPGAVSLVLILLAVFAGLATATWQFRSATIERDRAMLEARKAQRISGFLQEVLTSADPRSAVAESTIREALDRASQRVEGDLGDEPKVFADVQLLIGGIYERLNDHKRAEQHMRAALDTRRTLFGPKSLEVAATLSDLSWAVGYRDPAEQESMLHEAIRIYSLHETESHPIVYAHKSYLASCLNRQGEFSEAESLVRESLQGLASRSAPPDDELAFAAKVLAMSVKGQGRTNEAERAFRHALQLHQEVYPEDHYELGLMLSCYASFLSSVGKQEEAAAVQSDAYRILQLRVGSDAFCDKPVPSGKSNRQ